MDGKPVFGGDIYAYDRAPLILSLDPGEHYLDVRLVRDNRIMGGLGAPLVSAIVNVAIAHGGLIIDSSKLLAPEVVEGRWLASEFVSLPLCNEAEQWIDLLFVESVTV